MTHYFGNSFTIHLPNSGTPHSLPPSVSHAPQLTLDADGNMLYEMNLSRADSTDYSLFAKLEAIFDRRMALAERDTFALLSVVFPNPRLARRSSTPLRRS